MKGFTLIELLVVISIIALLMAILMPALNAARNQAKLLACKANSKQISTIIALYKAENDDFVPVVLNQAAKSPTYPFPAKAASISLSFADYFPEMRNLPDKMQPDKMWTHPDRWADYYTRYMPKCFSCPFVRKKEHTGYSSGTVIINTRTFKTLDDRGLEESYGTWLWGKVSRGFEGTPNHPLGLPHGTAKYGVLPWNRFDDLFPERDGGITGVYPQLADKPIRWNSAHLERAKVSSLSEATIVFCNKGQWDAYSNTGYIMNYGSHKRGSRGGTVAIFGDSHVEWVEGTRIGWW
jgi:prepilin-type N-terminal cleavage/methylation domain-containing protein